VPAHCGRGGRLSLTPHEGATSGLDLHRGAAACRGRVSGGGAFRQLGAERLMAPRDAFRLSTLLLLVSPALAAAQVRVMPLSDHVILLQSPRANMVASVGADGAVVVGEMDIATAGAVADSLSARSSSPRRVVVAAAGLASAGQADAGWDHRGALVIMQEFAVRRMEPPAGSELRRPRSAFSQFFSIELNGEPIHAVHQEPGYADSDVLVHFEGANVIYLGESFPGDGYPRVDSTLGGTVEGLLSTLGPWAQPEQPDFKPRFVGARGPLASSTDVLAFRDMVKAVSVEVRRLKQAGRNVDEVIAAHLTTAYEQRWGHGMVSADRFVRDVYQAVK
jgi:cyclase